MNRKEFRHELLAILKDAGVPQTLSREKFINLSWKKKNGRVQLFSDDIEKVSCAFVIKRLKMSHKYGEYRSFMGRTTI